MNRDDFRLICAALGFTAVIVREDVPQSKQALRAATIAKLTESFCQCSLPEAFEPECFGEESDAVIIDQEIARYKAELTASGSARLPSERQDLIQLYDRLLLRKAHRDMCELFEEGSCAEFSARAMRLIKAEIDQEWTEAMS